MIRTFRATLVLVFLVAFGLLTATYVIWTQGGQITDNERTISEQRAQAAKDRAALAEQRRFARALADQVRQLGGTPTPQPSTERTPQPATSGAADAAPNPAGTTPRPSRRPSTAPHPTASPKPTPSPSPSGLCLPGNICIPPGGTR